MLDVLAALTGLVAEEDEADFAASLPDRVRDAYTSRH
jgi:uncharacterized protein (DUF2267 family)